MVQFPLHMATNAEVTKTGNENNMSVIRRYTRRTQGTGLLRELRNRRYHSRSASTATTKKSKLKRIARATKYAQLIKEGKITERAPRR